MMPVPSGVSLEKKHRLKIVGEIHSKVKYLCGGDAVRIGRVR